MSIVLEMTKALNLSEIETPSIIVDSSILQQNIKKLTHYAQTQKLELRHHVKNHKSLTLAKIQLSSGSNRIAVAKAGEAEIMSQLNPEDLLISYPMIGAARFPILTKLAQRIRLTIACDHPLQIKLLEEAATHANCSFEVLPILDLGLKRCGVSTATQLVDLIRIINASSKLKYRGIQLYLGNLYGDAARDLTNYQSIAENWDKIYCSLVKYNLTPELVSLGSSTTIGYAHNIPWINELRVGTYLLNDWAMVLLKHVSESDCALTVHSTIVSNNFDGQIIIDAGAKMLSAKSVQINDRIEFGYLPDFPEAHITKLNEEHGWIDISACKAKPKLGEQIRIIPINASLCMSNNDYFYLQNEAGDLSKELIEARGKFC
jgi:D-serine deaminase-like pyridoxal phosphate-dependent protein